MPHPQWDLIETWIASQYDLEDRADAWAAACRQWLTQLGLALGRGHHVAESDHFLALAPQAEAAGDPLLQFAERCRVELLSVLDGVAEFKVPGKQVLVVLQTPDDYYRYLAPYFPDTQTWRVRLIFVVGPGSTEGTKQAGRLLPWRAGVPPA